MEKKYLKISLCINAAIMIIFAVAFTALNRYCKNQTTKERTYEFTIENMDTSQDGIEISINVPADKQWEDSEHHPDLPFGAQYDCIVVNNSEYEIEDWRVKIEFSDKMYIDSSWNGLFSTQNTTMDFAPTVSDSTLWEA